MRTYRQAALAATLGLAPIAADAAPASMLHTMPRAESAQAEAPSSGGMRWLTKWFRDEEPQPPAVVTAPGGVPAAMAYQPAQATGMPRGPVAPSIEAWGGYSPNVMVPTTPIASVAPTAAAPAPTPPSMSPTPATMPPTPATTPPATPPLPTAAQADAKTLRTRGHDLDRAGKLTEAEQTYRQAIGADPTSAAAVNDLGLCLARQGKLEQSAAVLRQAIMMRPDKPLYRNNIATVLVELDQADEALVHLKTAYGPATAHYNLGQLLSRAGKTGEAVAQLREAVRLEPTLGPAHEALARLTPQPQVAPTLANEGPQPTPAVDPYANVTPAPVATPPVAPYRPTQVASAAPAFVTPAAPTVAPTPTPAAPAGVPTFPRLLPPVLDR